MRKMVSKKLAGGGNPQDRALIDALNKVDIKGIFEQLNGDGDGHISMEEFTIMLDGAVAPPV